MYRKCSPNVLPAVVTGRLTRSALLASPRHGARERPARRSEPRVMLQVFSQTSGLRLVTLASSDRYLLRRLVFAQLTPVAMGPGKIIRLMAVSSKWTGGIAGRSSPYTIRVAGLRHCQRSAMPFMNQFVTLFEQPTASCHNTCMSSAPHHKSLPSQINQTWN